MARATGERPTLFLPIDIKVREFRPKLLVAGRAAANGYRVYLGDKISITAALLSKADREGVFYSKGGDRLQVLQEAKERCRYLVLQDEEVGPALSAGEVAGYWRPPRYTTTSVALIDRMFVFAGMHLDVLLEHWPQLADRAVVTGWPRIDLWRATDHGADAVRADELRRRHGEFVLFVSNFNVNSEEQARHRIEVGRIQHEQLPPELRPDSVDAEYGTTSTHRLESYHRCVEVLHELARTPDCPKIIVRPHPAEDPVIWRQAFAGVDNIEVIYEGEVSPWILAAKAQLHTGCTTALQAFHYGLPSGHLVDVGYHADTYQQAVSYRVSAHLEGTASILAFLADVWADRAMDRLDAPPEHMTGPLAGRAVDRIVDEIVALDVGDSPPVDLPRGMWLRSWMRTGMHRIKRSESVRRMGLRRYSGTAAQNKLPGGLHAREARTLLAGLPINTEVTVTEELSNLLRIEPAA